MKIVLDDNGLHLRFAPLTLTRPLGEVRVGIFTNTERWKLFDPGAEISYNTEPYLKSVYGRDETADLMVNASIIPNEEVAVAVFSLGEHEQLNWGDLWIAKRGEGSVAVEYKGDQPVVLEYRWDIYQKNAAVLMNDFQLITSERSSAPLPSSNTIIGDASLIFLEEGAIVEASVINTTSGPVYIGKNAEIMEGCLVRGPLALCEGSSLKMGSKVYGPTTLGPHCRVGGEINNVVFQAYSNKGHDGFLGNAVIGEWCNIGADSNCSNLKNNYGLVSTYDFETGKEEETDVQFMGLFMGDHSKCGINTMFNTATVVGVSANIFGGGFPSKYIPSFSWGGAEGFVSYRFDKAIESANNMMVRRGRKLTDVEIAILKHIADQQ
jgi:UDP-N-acetylglucosamine diphosphorylase/glucosamine-1-phosphate N-acetyltransferase